MSDCLCLDCKDDRISYLESVKFRAENRRLQLTELIKDNPGIHFRDLMRLTNLKNGVLSHHLKQLEKNRFVKVERLPRQTRFYPAGFSDEESKIAKALRKKTPREIILCLMFYGKDENKSLNFNQIVNIVSKSPSTVSIYLSQLVKDNIVNVTLDFGRKRKYHLSNIPLVDRLIEDHKPGALEKPVSGFEEIINSL